MNDSSQPPSQFRISKDKQALIQKLLHERGIGRPTTPIAMTRSGQTEGLPLSFAQERLWFLEQLIPGSAVYNIPTLVRLRGPLVPEALDHGLSQIVQRHTALRTVFTEHRGRPIGTVVPPTPVTTPIIDLTTLPSAARERAALDQANEQARSTFDLSHGPLLRTTLWRLGPDDYFFAILTHHIISEAWSIALLFDELEILYAEYVTGERPRPLPELPVDYADYARWERALAEREDHKAHVDYWVEQLADLPAPLLLATDRPRPSIPTQRGAIARREIPAELCKRVTALSHQEHATLFMVLLTAYDLLLHRYTGHRDVLVGSPISARGRVEVERLIGFFVGTIVVRSNVAGEQTVRQLLHQVRETTLEAFSHQDVAFERIVSRIQPRRELSHHPVFQVMFALQNTPRPKLRLTDMQPGIVLGEDSVHSETTKTELGLLVEQADDALTVWVEYASDVFEPETIERLLGHYVHILDAMVTDIDQRICDVALLTEREEAQHVEWNATGAPVSDQRTVVDVIVEQARRSPDAVAVAAGDATLTYGALEARANQLARHLQQLGVRPERLVAVCLERGPEMVTAQLAIMKAGGAYVPIDPSYPEGRVAYMLSDADLAAVITSGEDGNLVPDGDIPVVRLDRDSDQITHYDDTTLPCPARPDHLAYVIYTSGSTGRPKGVEIEHRGLSNLVRWHRQTYQITENDHATLIASVAFDASVWETWPYLVSGACLHVPDDDTRLSPQALIEWMQDQSITMAFLPTPVLEAVLQQHLPADLQLRAVLTGGDRLTRRPDANTPFAVINHYGPTESTVVTTAGLVAPSHQQAGPPPIGRPIANIQTFVLDLYRQPVPVGVPGELYVAGGSLARGYHRRPELTDERFVHIQTPNGRVRAYRTGDLVRYRPDGEIEFLGRIDEQVKVQGVRIELGEIEAVLTEHPAVHEAAVAVCMDGSQEARLVGYVAYHPGEDLTTSEVRRWLGRMLPKYMVPSVVLEVESLPKTPNGKVDRAALPDPFVMGQGSERPYEAPANESERIIAEVWQHLLPVDRIGRRDNFYEIGGHSLLSIQAVAAIAERTGVRLNPRILFFQDVAQIATALAGEHAGT